MALKAKTSLALAAAALCAATARAAVPTPAPADPTFPCKGGLALGMLAPTSGTAAAIGIDQVRWAQLFVARWNATHSITLRLQVLDTGLDAARAAATAQGLAADPTVLGVIGPAGSDEVVSAAPELQKARLSFVSPSAWSESLTTTAGLRGYFFRVVPHGGVQSATVVRFMTGKLKVGKGAGAIVVDDQVAADATLAAAVQQGLASRGVKVERQSFDQESRDFTTLLAKIKPTTKVVFAALRAPQTQALGLALRAAGKKTSLFGSDASFDPATFTLNGSYVSFFAPDITTMKQDASLLALFRKRYASETTPFGPPAYLAAQVYANAIVRACPDGRVSRSEVRKLLPKVRLPTTILGSPLAFTADGDVAGATFHVFQVVNGKYVTIA
jgi:branched-chain amino acid transport system substrate-binding protein